MNIKRPRFVGLYTVTYCAIRITKCDIIMTEYWQIIMEVWGGVGKFVHWCFAFGSESVVRPLGPTSYDHPQSVAKRTTVGIIVSNTFTSVVIFLGQRLCWFLSPAVLDVIRTTVIEHFITIRVARTTHFNFCSPLGLIAATIFARMLA